MAWDTAKVCCRVAGDECALGWLMVRPGGTPFSCCWRVCCCGEAGLKGEPDGCDRGGEKEASRLDSRLCDALTAPSGGLKNEAGKLRWRIGTDSGIWLSLGPITALNSSSKSLAELFMIRSRFDDWEDILLRVILILKLCELKLINRLITIDNYWYQLSTNESQCLIMRAIGWLVCSVSTLFSDRRRSVLERL